MGNYWGWSGREGEPKSERPDVLNSVECHEDDIDGLSVDRTYSDTNKMVCVGSRELRLHWDRNSIKTVR